VALPAFLDAVGERHHVQILDLSAGGAKAKCAVGFASGTTVNLDCGTFVRGAVVRWQDGGVHGLAFETELNTREMAALVARSNALAARTSG